MSTKGHQVRLSADEEFQAELKGLLSRVCCLGISKGKVREVVSVALNEADRDVLIEIARTGRLGRTDGKGRAASPGYTYVDVSTEDAPVLKRLMGYLHGEAVHDVTIIRTVHLAVCSLAKLDDEALRSAFDRHG